MADISILVITYNRSELLVDTIESLKRMLEFLPYSCEIVIADDCSDPEHRKIIDSISDARVVRTKRNSGLGANTNNGIAHCGGQLILQIQDDWRFHGDPSFLRDVYEFINNNSDVGVVQLTTVGTGLSVECRPHGESKFQVFRNDHLPWMRRCESRPYSDQPHLKRREFITNVGPYLEEVPMTICENDYKRRVANQARWKVAMLEGSPRFIHVGAEASFNSGGRPHVFIQILERLPWGKTYIEPCLRSVLRRVDHFAAKLMAR